VLTHPYPNHQVVVVEKRPQGVRSLNVTIYSIERDAVDSVFFAVVPDSFMTRESEAKPPLRQNWDGVEWADEKDRPLVSPNDRWSF
jgi:hypothetical protein